jgi:pimeloyl-ACP methyl ester carboxylesterase
VGSNPTVSALAAGHAACGCYGTGSPVTAASEPGTLSVQEHGTENETSIVFLHGGSVAGWMWEPQVAALQGEFHCLVPDLPGFGASNDRTWVSIDDAAADVRELVATRGHAGRAHLIGLSLGAVVGLQVLAQDANGETRIPSAVLSGTTVIPAPFATRIAAYAQLPLWRRRSYWAAMARAYGISAEDRDRFIESGQAIAVETVRSVVDEVLGGIDLVPVRSVRTPVLLASGSRDSRSIREASITALARALPQARAVLAPGGHHHWNAENPALFNAMVRSWVREGALAPGLEELPELTVGTSG